MNRLSGSVHALAPPNPIAAYPPMLDLSPDIAPLRPVRLADYRLPEFLVDSVDLVFDLDGANTRVKLRIGVRRNPSGMGPRGALELDGEVLGTNRDPGR